ncbi:MAG: GtrA family protein [Chloroflexota bacterium]
MTQVNTAKPIVVSVAIKPWKVLNFLIRVIASRFGSKSKEVERFLKFAFVGVIGTIVEFGTLFLLQATIIPPTDPYKDFKVIAAATIAFLAAVTSNFIWNRFWTYPDSRSRSIRRQMAQFTFINVIGLSIRTAWVYFSYHAIGRALMPAFVSLATRISPSYVPAPEADEKVGTLAATLVAVVFVMMWNFFANRYWTYNDVD